MVKGIEPSPMATICCTTRGILRRPWGSSRRTSPRRMSTSPVSRSPFRNHRNGARSASCSMPVSFTRALELRLRDAGQGIEAGTFPDEGEFDTADWTVSLLRDDDLRFVLMLGHVCLI